MEKIKVLELFGGIGACTQALKRCYVPHEVVDYVEIDKFAVKSYNAMNGTNYEPQDITKWDKDLDVDLIMHGSPCQDFSTAGKQEGASVGGETRSSLMYETVRIVGKLKPSIVIWENVKNILSQKHRHNFELYLSNMTELGYTNTYQVINSVEHGVPQKRDRLFVISTLSETKVPAAQGSATSLVLRDILEAEVLEKYYMSNERTLILINQIIGNKGEHYFIDIIRKSIESARIECKINQIGNCRKQTGSWSNPQTGRVYDEAGQAPTLSTMQGGDQEPKILEIKPKRQRGRRCKENNDPAFTITTQDRRGVITLQESVVDLTSKRGIEIEIDGTRYIIAIRKLTPLECWRLMGFDDHCFYKAKEVNSDSQLYKQAGNSIVVNVLEHILISIFN